MPQVKCTRCRIRLARGGPGAEHGDDPCPTCGAPLEPAASASEVLGFVLAVRPSADALVPDDHDHDLAVAVALPHPDTARRTRGGTP